MQFIHPTVFLVQPSDGREPDCARGEGAGVLGGVIQLNQRMGMLSQCDDVLILRVSTKAAFTAAAIHSALGFRYVPENLPLVEMPTLARGCGRGKRKGHISKKSRPHRIVSGKPCVEVLWVTMLLLCYQGYVWPQLDEDLR